MASYKTDPTVWDDIEANLFTVLKAIKQDDGYNFTVKEVVGWALADFPFRGSFPAVGVVIGSESANDIFGTNMRRCRRDVGIEMWVPAPSGAKTGDATFSKTYQKVIADLETALMADHTRGGNAEDTEILERVPAADAGKRLIGAGVRCQVIYRHQVGDLYTKL